MTSAQNTAGAGASLPQAEVYQAARQDKPWGHELIFAAFGDKYIGKIIHVNEGQSLSLQYHQEKDETISVISGEALFQYGPSVGRADRPAVRAGRHDPPARGRAAPHYRAVGPGFRGGVHRLPRLARGRGPARGPLRTHRHDGPLSPGRMYM